MKNSYKKQDASGKELSEEIGKGIDKIHEKKALNARKCLVGIQISEPKKRMFKLICEYLGIKQAEVLGAAIDATILKGSKV